MNFDVNERTILRVRHGSYAYGLNIPSSDEDFKGVCIKPRECYFGFTQRFEQFEHMGSKSDGIDEVIYCIAKFAALASDANPNIIEILHVSDKHILKCDEYGDRLREVRDLFLSKKAKFTFSGYAHAQLHRIKTHRSWLLNPPKEIPSRKSFGLSETSKVSKSELGAYDSMIDQKIDVELPKSVVTLFTQEKAYQAAKTHYDQYLNWVKSRNPVRAEMEAKFGFDGKHGMHLRRLQRMAKEILVDHKVYVDREERGDREELLDVRFGRVSYDALVEEAERIEAECEELYKTSTLRRECDRVTVDKLIIEITSDYLSKHG